MSSRSKLVMEVPRRSMACPSPRPSLSPYQSWPECGGVRAGATVSAADGGAWSTGVGAATTTESSSPVEFNVAAALAVDVVVAATTDEDIVALAAMEGVDAGMALEAIVAAGRPRGDRCRLLQGGCHRRRGRGDVITVSAGEPVWIGCGAERLRAACADAVEGVGIPAGGGEIEEPSPATRSQRQFVDGQSQDSSRMEKEELIAAAASRCD